MAAFLILVRYLTITNKITDMLRNIPSSRDLAVRADDWFGYGKPDPKRKWWLDIEEQENGEFQAAPPPKDRN